MTEPHGVAWRLLTLETGMESCRRNTHRGNPRHVTTRPPRRPTRSGWSVRWRAVNAPHLVALVRAGAKFERGKLVERKNEETATEAA